MCVMYIIYMHVYVYITNIHIYINFNILTSFNALPHMIF